METFKLKSVYVNSKYIRFLYPLMFLGLIIFVLNNPSIKFANTGLIVLAALAVIAWAVYDIYNVMRLKKFYVNLDEHEININNTHIFQWNDISAVTFHSVGFGMQAIITFNNDKKIKIPAVIENFEVLKNRIKKAVSESCTIVEK